MKVSAHFLPLITSALAEMHVQQRIAQASAQAAAKEAGLDGKTWRLSEDGRTLIVEG